MFWRWLFCLLEACVENCKDCTRLYSLKDKCPKNILPEFCFDSLNGCHEWIFHCNVIELDLNKHLRFFCCSVYYHLYLPLPYSSYAMYRVCLQCELFDNVQVYLIIFIPLFQKLFFTDQCRFVHCYLFVFMDYDPSVQFFVMNWTFHIQILGFIRFCRRKNLKYERTKLQCKRFLPRTSCVLVSTWFKK